jgi:hypothetical protein
MQTSVLAILIVFYAGALCASAKSWFGVWRGAVGYSALRDLTGIGDRATLRRLFGLTRPDGAYRVDFPRLLRHRRAAGVILTDFPVHLLFLAALSWVAFHIELPAAAGVISAAGAHALLLGGTAVTVLIGRPLPSSRGV